MSIYLKTPSNTDVVWNIINAEIAWSIAAVEVFFYGVYLIIFGFYLHVLRTRGMAQHRFLTASTISLFILGTAHCALQLAMTIFHVRILIVVIDVDSLANITNNLEIYASLTYATSAVYVTSNVIADSIFIFRCYAIWGSRREIIILPTILTLAVAGLGYCNLIMDHISTESTPFLFGPEPGPNPLKSSLLFIISVATSLFTTLVLMGLTVGRIWWLARLAGEVMGQKVVKCYAVCAMILESGALFCIGAICFVILSIHILLPDSILAGAVLGQLVGIAPTIIAVRVGLGYSIENVSSFIAAAPRSRASLQVIPATPSVESLDDQVLHIRADGIKAEAV
ncbi:hypothetical protein C8R44DRAFT_976472 [Mycena epipterygia]|nr:hypothetical protein C8R44DRAFT_976472 [Mycena epipterygia]